MAVVLLSVDLIGVEEGQEDVRAGTGTVRETWTIEFDRAQDLPALSDSLSAAGLPARNTRYGTSNAFCSNRELRRNAKDPYRFDATITYTVFQPGQQQPKPDAATDATKWNVQISGTFAPFEVPVYKDKNNKPLWNTNKEPIPYSKTKYDEQITVTFYVQQPEWGVVDLCIGHANAESVTMTISGSTRTLAINTLKLDRVDWSEEFDADGNAVTRYTYIFLYRIDTWDVRIPNASYYRKITSGADAGKLTPWLDANGQPKQAITYMDADGNEITTGDMHLLTFEVTTVTFATLLSDIG